MGDIFSVYTVLLKDWFTAMSSIIICDVQISKETYSWRSFDHDDENVKANILCVSS